MNNIEILRSGFSDSLDILKTEEMDFICGGDTDCKKNYSLSNNGTTISCGCGYLSTPDNLQGGNINNQGATTNFHLGRWQR